MNRLSFMLNKATVHFTMDQNASHIRDAPPPTAAGPSQPTYKSRAPVLLKEHLLPHNDVSEVGLRMLNHIRNESRLATAHQSAPGQASTCGNHQVMESQCECRKSLTGLLVDSLDGLAFCEQEVASIDYVQNGNECSSHLEDDAHGPVSKDSSYQDATASIEGSSSGSRTEPFPDYFESCETVPPEVNPQHEEAYNYAISKVVEEVIRFRDVDSRITTLRTFSTPESRRQTRLTVINEDDENNENTIEQRCVPHNPRQSHVFSTRPSFFLDCRESEKLRVIEEMRRLITDPEIQVSPKSCFHDLTNMVIRLEVVLFRNESTSPQEFLSAGDTYEVKMIGSAITRYLAVVDARLEELLDVGYRVHYILGDVSRDTSVNTFVRYRRISHVVFGNHLRRVTDDEKQLLVTFLDLYDTFVYTSFLNMRNRQMLLEEIVDIERNEITRLLVALWDILCRAIENYDRYMVIMGRIGSEYLGPVMDEVERALYPRRGMRWEQEFRMQLDQELEQYTEVDLSVLRPEDYLYP